MNRDYMNMFPHAPKDSGRFAVQSTFDAGVGPAKASLWGGLGDDAPIGPCLVRFFVVAASTTQYFHIEGSSGAADADATNGLRISTDVVGPSEVILLLNPRTDTHVDFSGTASGRLNWQIVSGETQSHPGG